MGVGAQGHAALTTNTCSYTVVGAVEVGLIHPPFGLNAFIIKGVAGDDVTIGTIFRGIVPFLAADFLKLALLVLFPIITLWLPATMR